MSIFQKQIDKLTEAENSVPYIFKNLKGKNVPISNIKKVKVLDANDEEFTFERDLSENELSYFREWIKREIQIGIRKQLEL